MIDASRRYLKARHPWLALGFVGVALVLAIATDWLSFGVDIRVFGGAAPRLVSAGEAICALIGISMATFGVSELSSWERNGSRSMLPGHLAWSVGVLVLPIVPLAAIPFGPVRLNSPGLADAEWISYAFGSIAPFFFTTVLISATALVAITFIGRFGGFFVALAAFLSMVVLQTIELPAIGHLPIPGSPGVVRGGWPHPVLVVVTAIASAASCILWRGRSRRTRG